MDPRIRTIRFWLLAALGVVLVAADCDLPLLAAYALSPLGLFMPVFSTSCICGVCDNSGAASCEMQIDISGMTNNACAGDCSAFDGTYILANPIVDTGFDCEWSATLSITECGNTWVKIGFGVSDTGTMFLVAAKLFVNGGYYIGKQRLHLTAYPAQPDCKAFASLSLPDIAGGSSTDCFLASSTWTVTSL